MIGVVIGRTKTGLEKEGMKMDCLSNKDGIRRLLQRHAKSMGFTLRAIEVLVKGSDGPRHCRAGSRVVASGDCADYVRLLVQGVARLVYRPPGEKDRELWIRLFGPGDFLFLPPVTDPLAGRVEIVAHGDVSVATMTRAHVLEAMSQMPPSGNGQLVSWTARTTQHVLLRKASLLCFDVERRVAIEMAALIRPFGERVGDGWLLDLKLLHKHIANLAGCGRARATRALGVLAKKRLIAKRGGRYWVSSNLLECLAESDAGPEAA